MLRLMKTECPPILYRIRQSEHATSRRLIHFVLLVFLIISGCATVKDRVVLVQDTDGKVGRLSVTTDGGTKMLTVPNTMVEVAELEKSPSDPREIDQNQIDSMFAYSIKAIPQEPISFLLYFLSGSNEITAESKSHIPEILSVVNKREFYEISIIGHTDTTGDDEYNLKLSAARAEVVRDTLISQGIRSDQIELRYHGKRDPLVRTGDNVSEPRNRRVEVIVK
jgi:outer membrane protein OmpA-like peptidoglycan-associated protein